MVEETPETPETNAKETQMIAQCFCVETDAIPSASVFYDTPNAIVVHCRECDRRLASTTDGNPPVLFTGVRGDRATTVYVTYGDGSEGLLAIQRGNKPAAHSPAGFEWGYAGSGPATLAESILTEMFRIPIHPKVYQPFKEEFVAKFPSDRWGLPAELVAVWLAETVTEGTKP